MISFGFFNGNLSSQIILKLFFIQKHWGLKKKIGSILKLQERHRCNNNLK